MKRNLFKRGMAELLSLVMCLTALVGLGTTTAFAAGKQAEVYLISFPRSGDANLDYGGSWGHPNLQYMNGWYSGNSKYTTIRAMHSYEGNICYCIEPGTAQETGDRYTSKDETFWDNLPADFNSTISPYDMKLFIGRIIHYIRNVVLEKIVLEAINSLADFVRCYEPVFLYLMAQKDIVSKRTETNRLKSSIESGKRRIQDLDKLIERIYEDQVLGNISAERYARMSINYENEQRELVKRVDEDEKRLVSIEQTSLDLKTLLKVLRSSTAFEELTPTLVNSLIRRIEVHNNDKSSGHCSVKVDIYFTAIGLIDIPTEDEIKSLMEKIQSNPQEYRLTA